MQNTIINNSDAISMKQSNSQIIKDIILSMISSLSGNMFSFGLGIMLLDTTHSSISFGLNMIVSPIASLLFFIPIGNLIDTYNHKRIIIISLIFKIIAIISLYFTIDLVGNNHKIIIIILFLFFNAILTNTNNSCFDASVHELVNQEKIQQLNSLLQVAMAVSSILSPVLGVIMYNLIGFHNFILFELISTMISLIVVSTMKFYEYKEEKPLQLNKSSFKDLLKLLKDFRLLFDIILFALVLNFIYSSIVIGIPFIIKVKLNLGNNPVSIIEMCSALGMLIGGIGLSLIKKGRIRYRLIIPLFILDIMIVGLGVLFNFENSYWIISIIGGLIVSIIAISLVILNVTTQVFLQNNVQKNILGKVMSTINSLNFAITPLGTIFFSFCFNRLMNSGLVFIVSGIFLIVYTSFFVPVIIKKIN